MENSLIRWNALEYTHSEKSVDWFWGLGLGASAIAITAIIFDNILLAIVIALGGFTVALLSMRKPRELQFEINTKGVRAGSEFHSWNSLDSFWLEEASNPPKIIFGVKRFLTPHVVIPVEGINLEALHAVLLDRLPQVEHHESVVDMLAERLGF